jgi:hypothetical protein
VNGPISHLLVPLTVKLVVPLLDRNVPESVVPEYQLISSLKVLEPPVLTCTEAM